MWALVPAMLDVASTMLILVLVALGLAVVLGLMRVINVAHGEFFLLGAYGVYVLTDAGVWFWIAAALAAAAVGAFGAVVEALLVRHLVRRTLDTILATWGLSVVIKQAVVLWFGPASASVAAPLSGSVSLGPVDYPAYRLTVMGISLAVLFAVAYLYRRTDFGLTVRASLDHPEMAEALGIDTRRVYRISFAAGAGIAGLAGALVAPLASIDPQMGLGTLVPAFLAVLVGGAGSLAGVLAGGALVGGLDGALSLWLSPVLSQVLVFAVAVTLIRLRPRGLFGDSD